jgi:hypothetical protein
MEKNGLLFMDSIWASGFKNALIGVYTPCSVLERRELWDDLTILR